MASFGGFGGFGSNNQQQNTGFGTGSGFGSTSGTGGFGQPATSGFGTTPNTNTGGSVFGGTAGGFGSSSGGFGTNTQGTSLFNPNNSGNKLFGQPTTTSSGSIFGNTASTSTAPAFGGGFGSATNTGFGTGATQNTSNLFGGANKTAFGGGTPNTGGNLFGSGGFGTTNTTSTSNFGGPASTALGASIPPSEGTAKVPFSEKVEKEVNTSNHFQSISIMDAYQKYSPEELRLADYNAGRRYGNGSNQAGAFGQPTGFGGFGSGGTTGGFGTSSAANPFGGATTTASNPFGTTQPTAAGFGGGNSLFGKPATTTPSLFGNPPSTAPASTGMFGGAASGGAFGSNTASNPFGGNQKPTGSLFTQPAGNTGTGFGQPGATGGSNLFGGSSGFGNNQQQQNQPANPSGFGAQQPQQNTSGNAFGSFGQQNQQQGSSLFGQKPNSTGGSSLFGSQPQSTGLFGSGNQQGSSLFGNQQQQEQKPGLFGGPGANQQQQGSSLFANQQQKPSLFGPSQGSSLFGQPNNNAPQSSLFGSNPQNQPQQQQGSSMLGTSGSSLFGSPQPNPLQQQQPGSLHTELLSANVYGSPSIFSGLPQPTSIPTGPVATPLKPPLTNKQAPPPAFFKIHPSGANRLLVSQQKKPFGFSYSTYGSPSSPSSSPGGSAFGGSLLGGGFGRSLGRTTSLTNLRRTFDPDHESIITAGAFSASSARFSHSSNSAKRLNIDKTVRITDIFASPKSTPSLPQPEKEGPGQPNKLKKRVSFDAGALGKDRDRDTDMSGALVVAETNGPEPPVEKLGYLRSSRELNGIKNGATRQPEMEQVRGNELAVVPEDSEAQSNGQLSALPVSKKPGDPEAGSYWSKPTLAELCKMSPAQLKHVENFEVGRENCCTINFDQPVDLTAIRLDELFGGVVQLDVRTCTVYPNTSPPEGKGINVPSTIRMENSWARSSNHGAINQKNGAVERHIQRLKKSSEKNGTEFVSLDRDTGVWTFKVPHFTTYEMYDEDDLDDETLNQSTLSAPPDTPTPKSRSPSNQPDTSMEISDEDSALEDTYEFKKKVLPGSFENQAAYEDADDEIEEGDVNESVQPFLGDSSAGSSSDGSSLGNGSEEESESDEDMEMAGSFPQPAPTVERTSAFGQKLGSIFKESQQPAWTPGKVQINLDSTWAQQLQQTVSPRKQDREALREFQGNVWTDREIAGDMPAERVTEPLKAKGFRNSMDLMSSIFGQHEEARLGKKKGVESKGFEWPYSKKPKTFTGEMSVIDREFHSSFRPNFGPHNELTFTVPKDSAIQPGIPILRLLETPNKALIVTASIEGQFDFVYDLLHLQQMRTAVTESGSVPHASMKPTDFGEFSRRLPTGQDTGHESQIWQLAHLLFDDYDDDISDGVPEDLRPQFADRIRKDRLGRFWSSIVKEKINQDFAKDITLEEQAIIHLTAGNVRAACKNLLEAKDFHLATLVAQIGGDDTFRNGIRSQIDEWYDNNVISEMTDPIRAVYELLTGNACKVKGAKGQVEDRASEFVISDRFQLDWQQSFALRLWCVIYEDEPIEAAVLSFETDIWTMAEPSWPDPYFDEDEYGHAKSEWRQSPLWILLQIYASSKTGKANDSVELPASIMPQSVAGNTFNTRLTFQLYQALTARSNLIFRTSRSLSDQLTIDLAMYLSSVGQYVFAALVLLYLPDKDVRERLVKDLLARNAPAIPDPHETAVDGPRPEEIWECLTSDLGIPTKWIWEAKALYARSLIPSDELAVQHEVRYLLAAESWDEAHGTLCRVVGPKAIVERDYEMLEHLLKLFNPRPEQKVKDWLLGGAVYNDFVRVMLDRVEPTSADGRRGRATVLKKLIKALPEMAGTKNTFEESVAINEMASVVVELISDEDSRSGNLTTDPENILRLPLTEDQRVKQALEVGIRYYGGVMAQGR